MTLSKNHYLLVKNGKNLKYQRKTATDLRVGDIVPHTEGKNELWMEGTLTKIEMCVVQREDLMNVWTTSMNIVVDNIASSCHIATLPTGLVNATVQAL